MKVTEIQEENEELEALLEDQATLISELEI